MSRPPLVLLVWELHIGRGPRQSYETLQKGLYKTIPNQLVIGFRFRAYGFRVQGLGFPDSQVTEHARQNMPENEAQAQLSSHKATFLE